MTRAPQVKENEHDYDDPDILDALFPSPTQRTDGNRKVINQDLKEKRHG